MVTPATLRELIETDVFGSVADEVCRRTKACLFPTYEDTLFEATRIRYEKSDIPIGDLFVLLKEDRSRFTSFSCALVLDSRDATIDQEYPASEKPGKDDRCVIVQELGLARDFIVRHLIIYWYLVNQPDQLEAYLKATRVPNAKKQVGRFVKLLKAAI